VKCHNLINSHATTPSDRFCPSQTKRNRQTENDQEDDQTNYSIRNIEDRKHLRDSLGQRPATNDIGNRHLINVAPFQLGRNYRGSFGKRGLAKFPCRNNRSNLLNVAPL